MPRLGRNSIILILTTVLTAAIVGVGLLHQRILRVVAGALIVDQSEMEFDHLCLMSEDCMRVEGDDACETAARLYRESSSRRVLLLDPSPLRLIQVGAAPSFSTTMRKGLSCCGVPWSAVDVQPIAANYDRPKMEALAAWLQRYPQSRVQLLCDRFKSAVWRRLLDELLTPDQTCRVSLRALPRQEYDETNWWRRRRGVRDLMFGYLAKVYAWTEWRDCGPELPSDPAAYERRFLQGLQEARAR